jgi:nitrite reductase/ring-hydroxylating ferredoxin subunit
MTDGCACSKEAGRSGEAGELDGGAAPRRTVLRGLAALGALGAAAGVLAGCGSDEPGATGSASSGSASEETSPAGDSDAAGGGALAKAADVPVGGATVIAAQKIVVSQPTAGSFKAFSAVCTHKGCTVGVARGLDLKCPCHGSEFDAATGAVKKGPAAAPLAAKNVSVQGEDIVLS